MFQQIRNVGNDEIDAQQICVRKHQAAVDGNEIVARLDQHHVEPDLTETAEGNEADCVQDIPFVKQISS